MSNLTATYEQLATCWKVLHQRWEAAQSQWNDPVSRDFEKIYWTPLEAQVQLTHQEMGRLAQVIAQARRNVK